MRDGIVQQGCGKWRLPIVACVRSGGVDCGEKTEVSIIVRSCGEKQRHWLRCKVEVRSSGVDRDYVRSGGGVLKKWK